MNTSMIQQQLDLLAKEALDKGLAQPRFVFEIENGNTQYCGRYSWTDEGRSVFEYVFSSRPGQILQAFQAVLAAVPSKAERERNEYLKRLASTIEYGRSIGLDPELINPLAMQMKELSANVIEHRPEPRDYLDDMPF